MSVCLITYSRSGCAHSHPGSFSDSQEGLLAFPGHLLCTARVHKTRLQHCKKYQMISFFCCNLRNLYSYFCNSLCTQSVPPNQLAAPKLTEKTVERHRQCAAELLAIVLYLVWVLYKDDSCIYWYLMKVFIHFVYSSWIKRYRTIEQVSPSSTTIVQWKAQYRIYWLKLN